MNFMYIVPFQYIVAIPIVAYLLVYAYMRHVEKGELSLFTYAYFTI